DEVILTFNTDFETATLQYRGTESECSPGNKKGYNTWMTEFFDNVTTETVILENDLDDDMEDDKMYVDGDNLIINLSTAGAFNVSEGEEKTLENETETFAYITVENLDETNEEAHNVTIEPYKLGEGYFSAIYELTGDNHAEGVLQQGDVVRLCFQSPGEVGESEDTRINFVPRAGTTSTAEFATPDIITTQRVYLYP
ncbi:MAG: hypothetical protein ACOCZQ_01230, partial [Nanoarchaeota archaeon]